MKSSVPETIVQVIILDISGVYAQIYNQGYFDRESIDRIMEQYSDVSHWRIILLD